MLENNSQQLYNDNNYATVDQVVRSTMASLQQDTMHNYKLFLHYAIEGLEEFNFDQAQEVKTVRLKPTDWNAIKLPSDYVDWVKIGVQNQDQVTEFDRDENIALYFNETECGDPIAHTKIDCNNDLPGATSGLESMYGNTYSFSNYINESGEHEGKLYGYGKDKSNGRFKVNRERGEIQINASNISDYYYLEYISNGFNPSENTVLNQYAKKLIKLYIIWQYHEYNSEKYLKNSASRHEDLYYTERTKVSGRIYGLSANEILKSARDGYMLSVKT